jgi:hypothetical protein
MDGATGVRPGAYGPQIEDCRQRIDSALWNATYFNLKAKDNDPGARELSDSYSALGRTCREYLAKEGQRPQKFRTSADAATCNDLSGTFEALRDALTRVDRLYQLLHPSKD